MNTYTHWHLGSTSLKYEGDWNIPILTPIQPSPEWGVRGDQSVFTDVYMKGLHDGNRPLGRYLLTNDGEARKLDPTDSSKYLDGSPVNEEDGDVMVYLPKLYYKVTTEDFDGTTCEVLHCSVSPISGGRVTGGTYLGAYMASMDSEGKLHSWGGGITKTELTVYQFHDAAKKNGERYGIMSYMQWCQLMMIQLSAFGSPDAQGKVGFGGYTNGPIAHGHTESMGDQSGSGSNSSVNFFGLENLWRNNWQFLQGVFGKDGSIYIHNQTTLFSPDDILERFLRTNDYRRIILYRGYDFSSARLLGKYFDLFPKYYEKNGSGDTYWTDALYIDPYASLMLVGGSQLDKTYECGLGCISASQSAFPGKDSDWAARLAYFPEGCPVY